MFEGLTVGGLAFGLIFSTIGLAMFRKGKDETDGLRLVCGLLLMAYPYFFSNTYAIAGLGILLTIFPFALEQGIPYIMSFFEKDV